METVLKISSASDTGRLFINRLLLWYDSFAKPEIQTKNCIKVYAGSDYLKNQNLVIKE